MKERNSELKLTVVYILILGCWLLGIDVQQLLMLFLDTEQYTKDLRILVTASADKGSGAVVGGALTGLYALVRTYKKSRE